MVKVLEGTIKESRGFKATYFVDLINIFTGSSFRNRQHHGQTIHPTEKLISMNLFKILCVVTSHCYFRIF